jgi:hypothetical protein
MEVATVETRNPSGTLLRRERTTYYYDHIGISVSAINVVDANGDGTFETVTKTEYLNDPNNFTGYSQVLRETVKDANGNAIKQIDDTLGHDQIIQAVTENGTTTVHIFATDGHGSVRVLLDMVGAIAQGSHLGQRMTRNLIPGSC